MSSCGGPEPAATAQRNGTLDVARGAAIALVVFSHAVGSLQNAARVPIDGGWSYLSYTAYTFHVPVFFVVSGVLARAKLDRRPETFWDSKVRTLALPYFAWSVVYAVLALVMGSTVNNPIGWKTLLSLPWEPYLHFWFLYALLLAHVLAWLMRPLGAGATLALGAMLWGAGFALPRSGIVQAEAHFFLFYAIGLNLGRDRLLRFAHRPWAPIAWAGSGAALLLVTASAFLGGLSYQSPPALLATVLGLALTFAGAARLDTTQCGPLLRRLGRASMAVYVLHVLVAAAARAGLDWAGWHDPAAQIVLATLCGLVGPVALEAAVSRMGEASWLALGAAVTPATRAKPRRSPAT